jgi:hypothetical protein
MLDVRAKIFSPQSFLIPEKVSARRTPFTPPSDQSEQFRRNFDYRTFIYDCAWDRESSEVILLAPSFYNLRGYAEQAHFIASPGWRECSHSIAMLDTHDQIRVRVPPGSSGLHLVSGLGMQAFRLDASDLAFFEGRRVLLTKSKNNEIVWLRDWIAYHQVHHGADAVLIFDNASDRYDIETLLEALSGIPGIARLGIVTWPFPWGGRPPPGSEGIWEDHCQYGALETAHWRFLQFARSVANFDVDELIKPLESGTGFFSAAEEEPAGVAVSAAQWTVLVQDERFRTRVGKDHVVRHRDFSVTTGTPPQAGSLLKWAAVPAKLRGQWGVHRVAASGQAGVSLGDAPMPSPVTSHWHLKQLSTSWRYDRSDIAAFDPRIHQVDEALKGALASLASAWAEA